MTDQETPPGDAQDAQRALATLSPEAEEILAELSRRGMTSQVNAIRGAARMVGQELKRRPVAFSKSRRELVLAGVASGLTVTRAAQIAGVSQQAVSNAAVREPEGFGAALNLARDLGADEAEERLREIGLTGDGEKMATIKALELVLKGATRRYRLTESVSRSVPIRTTMRPGADGKGEISVEVGDFGPD